MPDREHDHVHKITAIVNGTPTPLRVHIDPADPWKWTAPLGVWFTAATPDPAHN